MIQININTFELITFLKALQSIIKANKSLKKKEKEDISCELIFTTKSLSLNTPLASFSFSNCWATSPCKYSISFNYFNEIIKSINKPDIEMFINDNTMKIGITTFNIKRILD